MKLVPKITLKEMVVNSTLRQPLVIAMMMMMAQQLSGINCVSLRLLKMKQPALSVCLHVDGLLKI
jgi:hypothetical protein